MIADFKAKQQQGGGRNLLQNGPTQNANAKPIGTADINNNQLGNLKPLGTAPTLTPEASASNIRTAQALLKSTDHSAIKPHINDALKTGGAQAQAEVRDLTQQMDQLQPGSGTKLAQEVGLTIQAPSGATTLSAGTDNSVAQDGGQQLGEAKTTSQSAAPAIPKNKTELFKGREKEWKDFYDSTGKLGVGEREREAYMGVFGQEGGMKKDPEGSAASGITQGTLDDMIKRGKISGIELGTEPSALNVDQRAKVYKAYFDEKLHSVGGSNALNSLPDSHASQTLADSLFRQGQNGAAKSIQDAANRVKPGIVNPDKKFGKETLGAYITLTNDPKMRDKFYKVLAEERWKYAQEKLGGHTGDKMRAQYYGTRQ